MPRRKRREASVPLFGIEECDLFFPRKLTEEESLLPWSEWRWDHGINGYRRSCTIENPHNGFGVGLSFTPTRLFEHGVLEVHQWAKRSKGAVRRKNLRQALAATIQLGIDPSQWHCSYCSGVGTEHKGPDGRTWYIDHLYPRALGGDSRRDNLVLACATCNISKGSQRLADFLARKAKAANAQE